MSVVAKINEIVEPIVSAHKAVEIYDLEYESGILRVVVDRPGGIDVDTIGELATEISEALDLQDPLPENKYLLEVTSPGIERKLRTPAHFMLQINEEINLKTMPDVVGPRRMNARLIDADEDGITVVPTEGQAEERRLRYDQVESARTIFHWGEQTTSPRRGKAAQSHEKKAGKTTSDKGDDELVSSDGDNAGTTQSTNKKASA